MSNAKPLMNLNLDYLDAPSSAKVVVAMSGGVDSTASALYLKELGWDVVGVSMQVWDYKNNGGNSSKQTCCSPADFEDAREAADKAGFPFYVFDFEDSFKEKVIDKFVGSYLSGKTPNPCIECNRKVKFARLRDRANKLGIPFVATGHYAQIKKNPSGQIGLYTSKDLNKDQTYFLYSLTEDDLKKTIFPVGGVQKNKVRNYLKLNELDSADKGESQDICFVSDSVSSFISKQADNNNIVTGSIKDAGGEVLGSHQGIHNYTIGQRKGLGISSNNPLYVINIDSDSGDIKVGSKEDLQTKGLVVNEVSFVNEVPNTEFVCLVKLRYRHSGVRCKVVYDKSTNEASLEFLDEWSVVSPGQAAVFYALDLDEDGDRQVIGGGVIKESL